MYYGSAFVLGFISALITYYFIHAKLIQCVRNLEAKYERILDILQEWQKKI